MPQQDLLNPLTTHIYVFPNHHFLVKYIAILFGGEIEISKTC